jgi:hypothetical protein
MGGSKKLTLMWFLENLKNRLKNRKKIIIGRDPTG